MADKKISALTASALPLAGTEVLPIVQGGVTVKVSVDDLTNGKVVTTGPIISVGTGKDRLVIEPQNAGSGALLLGTNAAGSAYTPVLIDGAYTKFSVGGTEVARTGSNGIAPVAGKGIDFSANGGDVLSQYDEGMWNVVWTGLTGTPANLVGSYTRIGRLVFFNYATGANSISGSATSTYFSLPFTPAAMCAGVMLSENVNNSGSTLIHTSTRVYPEAFSSSFMVFSGSFYI